MTANDFLPDRRTLPALMKAARACQGCNLYRNAHPSAILRAPEERARGEMKAGFFADLLRVQSRLSK